MTVLTMFPGCDTKTNKGKISASAFSAAQLATNGLRLLTSRLDLLRTLFPNRRDQELQLQQAEAIPFSKIGDHLGVFETRNGAVCTIDLCDACTAGVRSSVRMHYDRAGLEEELADAGAVLPVIDDTVDAIELSNGWVLAYERRSRSIIAFREQAGYRTMLFPDENDPNFGRGNGLIISLVISGLELQAELQTGFQPRVTRMHELSDGRVMLFFQEIFREIHILNVASLNEAVDFDLADPDNAPVPTEMLRGSLLPAGSPAGIRPAPFVTFDQILDVTQGLTVDIDSFQPVRIPSDGSTLVYDRVQSVFLRFFVNPNGTSDIVLGANNGAIGAALLSFGGSFNMTHSWLRAGGNEVMILEEETNTIIAYNFRNPNPGQSVRSVVNSVDIVSERRDPDGEEGIIPGGAQEPVLNPAVNDLAGTSQRLLFDRGRDELISISYGNGVVVIVAKRDVFSLVTGHALVDLTYIEGFGASPQGGQSIRAWDTESTALLEVLIDFKVLPDVSN